MRDFRLLNETALQPVVDRARRRQRGAWRTAASARRQATCSSRSCGFPFQQEGWVITIADAALRGAALGATASGTINLPGGKMAISGTFIPAFGLNNIAGAHPDPRRDPRRRPQRGPLRHHLQAVRPARQPASSTMNPISAIAPGIFRKIFEYR